MQINPQAGFVKVLLLVLIIAAAVIVAAALFDEGKTEENENRPAGTSQTTTSPDRVKQQGVPNADTAPSPSGTGPGSDNSILSQP